MSQTKNEQDKKVLAVTQELSQLLIEHQYDAAWEKAGELNGLLKSKNGLTMPPYMIGMLVTHMKSYYYQNNQIQKAHKVMSAIGHKLAEFQ